MRTIVVASKNKGKIKEFKKMFENLKYNVLSLDDFPNIIEPEETGKTFMENAKLKASYYAKKTSFMCVADDSGIEVEALKGAPGVYSARYAGKNKGDRENNILLLKNMQGVQNRNCQFFCALALSDKHGKIILKSDGVCKGILLQVETGNGGFGYDPLFYSIDLQKSLAEATEEEKNSISHRGRALRQLVGLMENLDVSRNNR